MAERYAIIDVMNLAYRYYYVVPNDIWLAKPGTLFMSLMKTCTNIAEDLAVDQLVFCFDDRSAYRKSIYPEYKAGRRKGEQDESLLHFFKQVEAFRDIHLPEIGATGSIFYERGFEADDLMASCVRNMDAAKKIYLVTSDEDLYQCIEGTRVVLYKFHKKEIYAESDFRIQHKDMAPCLYSSAKAWAGCTSDNIPGIKGIGMIKACQYIMGKSPPKDVATLTTTENLELFNRNVLLTRLPAPGTPRCIPQDIPPLRWDELADKINAARPPRGIAKR